MGVTRAIYLSLVLAFLSLGTRAVAESSADSGRKVEKAAARMLICHYSVYGRACGPKISDGAGYGWLVFENEAGLKRKIVAFPGGANTDEAAIMAGRLQAFMILQSRKFAETRDPHILTDRIQVSGFVTKNPITGKGREFHITEFKEIN